MREWSKLPTDAGAKFDRELVIDAATLVPYVSWGTSPGMVAPITATVPDPAAATNELERKGLERALEYMGLKAGTPLEDIAIDRVFIGSCTNGRHRGFARRGTHRRGTQGGGEGERDGGSGFAGGEGAGGGRRAGPHLPRGGI